MSLRALACVLPLSLMLGGGAIAAPAKVSTETGPKAPAPAKPPKPKKGAKAFPPCRLFVGEVKDLRTDPGTMGYIGAMIYVEDVPGWVRAGYQTLVGDARFTLVETPEEAEVRLQTDLIKGYISSNGLSKSATVVLRVHYSAESGALGENVYRGSKESVNWIGTSGEAIGSLNISLVEAIDESKADLMKGCTAVRAGVVSQAPASAGGTTDVEAARQ